MISEGVELTEHFYWRMASKRKKKRRVGHERGSFFDYGSQRGGEHQEKH